VGGPITEYIKHACNHNHVQPFLTECGTCSMFSWILFFSCHWNYENTNGYNRMCRVTYLPKAVLRTNCSSGATKYFLSFFN